MADLGIKLGIESEKEFRAALQDINQSLKTLGTEMTRVASEFDKSDNSTAKLAKTHEVLAKQIDTQKSKIELLQSALDKSASSYGENDKRTQSYAQRLNLAQAELNNMERELKEGASAVDEFGDELDDTGKKTTSFGELLKANLASQAIISGIKAIASAVKEIGVAFIGAMKDGVMYNAEMESYTTSFTTMMGDQAKAQQLVIDLKKEAAATPFGMRDLADAQKTLMGFGMSAEDAQVSMKMLGDVSQGNAERFKSLTLAFAQVSAGGKLTGQDLLQMINAGFNPLNEIAEMTGASMADLKAEMSSGAITADMVAEAFAHATSEGGRFNGAMEAQSKTFSGQLATMQDGIAALKGQVAEGLTTMLSGTVMPMVNGWITELSAAFESGGAEGLIDCFGGVLKEAVAFLTEQLPTVLDIGTKVITSLVQGIVEAIPQIMPAATDALMAFVGAALEILPDVLSAGVSIIASLIDGIGEALPELIPLAVRAIGDFVAGLGENLPMLITAGLNVIMGLVEGLINAIPEIIKALPQIISGIVTGLMQHIPEIIMAGVELLGAIVLGIPQAIVNIVASIPSLIGGIVGALLGHRQDTTTAGEELGTSVGEGVNTGVNNFQMDVQNAIAKRVREAQAGVTDEGVKLGGSFTAGVKNGYERTDIVDIAQWAQKKINEASAGVTEDGVKLGGSFAKTFSSGVDDPTIDLTPTVMRWIDGAKSAVSGAVSSAQEAGRSFMKALTDAGTTIEDGIKSAVDLVSGVIETVKGGVSNAVSAGTAFFTGIGSKISTPISNIVTSGKKLVDDVVSGIKNAVSTATTAGSAFFTGIGANISPAITNIVTKGQQLVTDVVTAVKNGVSGATTAGASLFNAISSNVSAGLSTAQTKAQELVGKVQSAISGGVSSVATAGSGLFQAISSNVSSAISSASSAASRIVEAVRSGISNAASSLATAGRNMIDGMWSGISSAIESLKSKISNGISAIGDKVKSVLGIKSPSRVYAEIGKNMGAGIGVGFDSIMERVSRDMQDAIPKRLDMPGFNTDTYGISGNTGMIGQNGATVNQTINITSPKALSERELFRESRILSQHLAMSFA